MAAENASWETNDPSASAAPAVLNGGASFPSRFPAPQSSSPPNAGGGSDSAAIARVAEDEVVIEIELALGAEAVGAALISNPQGFMGNAEVALPTSDMSTLRGLLVKHGLQEARRVRSEAEDEANRQQLRDSQAQASFSGDVTRADTLSSLPPPSSYLRLQFPSGTPASPILEDLRLLPKIINQAVAVPKAAPPLAACLAQLPGDPLIGSGQLLTDSQTGLDSQWYLHRTRVPHAWHHTLGAGVVVADIDWGYRITHQDLQEGAITRTYNAVDGGEDVTYGPHIAHGTAVLGLAGARSNAKGMVGYAPEAELWAIQGDSSPNLRKFTEPWVEAIDFVRRTPANGQRKVLILEVQTGLGGNYEQLPSVQREIRAAIADGCLVCVAAGNGNRSADQTDDDEPFHSTGSILVGATAYDPLVNRRAWFSNFGSHIVVSAPGDENHDLTCGPETDNGYVNAFGGTSGATPKVAGTVALMLSVNPTLTHQEIRDILTGTGSPLAEEPGKPIGVFLNTEAAVAEALRRWAAGGNAERAADVTPENAT